MKEIFNRKVFILSAFLLLLSTAIINADNNEEIRTVKLSVNDAVSLALKNNLGLESERLKVDQKKWALWTSWNVFIPKTTLSASMMRSNKEEADRKVSVLVPIPMSPYITTVSQTIPEWGVGLSLEMTLAVNAAMVMSIYQTALDYEAGKLTLDSAAKKVERDTRKNYYQLLLLKENIILMRENVDAAKKRYEQALVSSKFGQIPRLTMLNIQVAYENIKPALLELENAYATASMAFKNSIGISGKTEVDLIDMMSVETVEIDRDKILAKSLVNRSDIKQLNQTIKMMENVRGMNIASLTPSFLMRFTVDPSFQKDPVKDDWFGDSTYMTDNWKQRSGSLLLGISVPVDSWFPFSGTQMKIVESNFTLEQLNITKKQILQGNEIEIESIIMKLEKSIKSMEALSLNVEIAREAMTLSEQAFNAGSKDLIDLQSAELEYKKAKNNLLQEKYNFNTGLLDLRYIIGE